MDDWLRNPTNDIPLKKTLSGTVKLVKNVIKCKFNYNGEVIAFYGESEYSFGNYFTRNVLILSVSNGSSSHT